MSGCILTRKRGPTSSDESRSLSRRTCDDRCCVCKSPRPRCIFEYCPLEWKDEMRTKLAPMAPLYFLLHVTGVANSCGVAIAYLSPGWQPSGGGRRAFPLWQEPTWDPSTGSSSLPPQRPFPLMPSQLFQELAASQLELLASSLSREDGRGRKTKSMALYLPQENSRTGQLEFLPAILYPPPSSERVFIASDSDSGRAPTMPRTLTKLPGFAHATSLLPGYPMVFMSSSSDLEESGAGLVEEVLCDI